MTIIPVPKSAFVDVPGSRIVSRAAHMVSELKGRTRPLDTTLGANCSVRKATERSHLTMSFTNRKFFCFDARSVVSFREEPERNRHVTQ